MSWRRYVEPERDAVEAWFASGRGTLAVWELNHFSYACLAVSEQEYAELHLLFKQGLLYNYALGKKREAKDILATHASLEVRLGEDKI